mmetsp:Transcript_2261/g.2721  ORF Transcript_2261/g.2721 Transcript_2261/m.2721 type:complete len:250 (+) Transcript_2261:477-1226(+)
MSLSKDGSSWSFVHSTTLDSNEAVFNDINSSNSVLSCHFVAVKEELERVGFDSSVIFVGNLDWNTILEFDLEGFRFFGCVLRTSGHFEHRLFRRAHGIFEISRLVRCVEKILVDRVVGFWFSVDGNSMLGAVVQKIFASLETFDEFCITPWGNTLNSRRKCLATHLETDLIVTFSGSTMSNVGSAFLCCDANHFLGNARPGDGGTKKVSRFVNGIALHTFEDVFLNEFLSKVGYDALKSTARDSLSFDG